MRFKVELENNRLQLSIQHLNGVEAKNEAHVKKISLQKF